MGPFSVWAPRAERVEVVLDTRRIPLDAGDDGVFRLPDGALPPGTSYRLRLDDGEPRPDPRSGYQPEGVHGPSVVVDHSAFGWTDAAFVPPDSSRALIYELHVGTFTPGGTFVDVIGRLDHLVQLGVTHVELMPIAEFPGVRGWGYDGVCLFAP